MIGRRGVFWPLLLIAVGLLFLLANLGFISGVSWVAVLSLWPLLLVLMGLDIAFARRWPLPTLVAEVAVIAAGLALAAVAPSNGVRVFTFTGTAGGIGQSEVTAARAAATGVTVHINGGGGRYHVSGGAAGLLDAQSPNPDLRLLTSGSAGHPDLRLDVNPEAFGVFSNPADIQVHIASDVPTSFEMNAGAGEFDIDLSDVRVTDARVNAGASSTRLVLPKPSGDVRFTVNGGASSIAITVPDGVDVRIRTTGGLLSLRSDNMRVGQGGAGGCLACGNSVQTSGYDTASDRITLTISAGASSIVVH